MRVPHTCSTHTRRASRPRARAPRHAPPTRRHACPAPPSSPRMPLRQTHTLHVARALCVPGQRDTRLPRAHGHACLTPTLPRKSSRTLRPLPTRAIHAPLQAAPHRQSPPPPSRAASLPTSATNTRAPHPRPTGTRAPPCPRPARPRRPPPSPRTRRTDWPPDRPHTHWDSPSRLSPVPPPRPAPSPLSSAPQLERTRGAPGTVVSPPQPEGAARANGGARR